MSTFRFAKLVRDKIVDHQIASGARPHFHLLSSDEHKLALIEKITEEAQEIAYAPPEGVVAEIADVQQAIDDLKALYGASDSDVMEAQAAKNAKNGAFTKGVFIDYVEVSEGDAWVEYYRRNADRYPEFE